MTETLIFHMDDRGSSFYTPTQLRLMGFDPSHYANVLHYATTGFEGIRLIYSQQHPQNPAMDMVKMYDPHEMIKLLHREYEAITKGGKLEASKNEEVRRRIRTPILTL